MTSSPRLPFEPAPLDEHGALEHLHARLAADLEATQGRTRRAPATAIAVIVMPVVVIVVAAVLALSVGPGVSAAVVAAVVAAIIAVAAVAIAPHRPALGERGAQLAVVVGLGAVVLELAQMVPGGTSGAALCLTTTTAVMACAGFATVIGLYRSGLPLRRWHHVGVGVVAVAGACVAVWQHCGVHARGHLLIAHVGGPVLLVFVMAAVVMALERHRAR